MSFWVYFLADYGADHPRYGSTLAAKGPGHIIRKGTGGRSSVRYYESSFFFFFGILSFVVLPRKKM